MRKFFSLSIYKEGLRQLRLPGITLGSISILINLLIPIVLWGDAASGTVYYWGMEREATSLAEYTVVPVIFSYLAPILLCFILFQFVVKRAGTDFYGALPYNRKQIYSGFVLAIITYLVGAIVASVILSALLFWLSGYFYVKVGQMLIAILAISVAAILMTGAVMVGLSLSGRLFTAFFVGMLTLFLPRFMVGMFYTVCKSIMPWQAGLQIHSLPQILQHNLLVAFPFSAELETPPMLVWQNIAYTAVLGILFLGLAGVLFHFRKAEVSGESAAHPMLQNVYRIAISIPLVLLIAFCVLERTTSVSLYIVLSVVCLIVYYGFELITTRTWRKLPSATKWLGVLVAVGVVFIGAVYGYGMWHYRQQPTAEQIECIKLVDFSDYTLRENVYGKYEVQNIKFDEPTAKRIVCNALKKELKPRGVLSSSQSFYEATLTVEIVYPNGRSIYRRIPMTHGEYRDIVATEETYKQKLTALPQSQYLEGVSGEFNFENYTKKQQRQIYETFYAEYMALPVATRMSILSADLAGEGAGYNFSVYIVFQTKVDGEKYINSFHLPQALFPKTLQTIATLQNRGKIIDQLRQQKQDFATVEEGGSIHLRIFNTEGVKDVDGVLTAPLIDLLLAQAEKQPPKPGEGDNALIAQLWCTSYERVEFMLIADDAVTQQIINNIQKN